MRLILSASEERVHAQIFCRDDFLRARCCRNVLQRAPYVRASRSDSAILITLPQPKEQLVRLRMKSDELEEAPKRFGPVAVRALAVGAQSIGAIAAGALAIGAVTL